MTARIAACVLALTLLACPAATPVGEPKTEGVSYAQESGLPGAVAVVFQLPRDGSGDIFDTPWPSELRRTASGRLDVRGFPGRDHFVIANAFDEAEERMVGYSVQPVVYFRFTAPGAAEELEAAVEKGTIRLLDVDPKSPERGKAHPLHSRYYAERQRYVAQDTLALRPRYPLREGTLHALVVPRTLGSITLGTSTDFEHVKHTAPLKNPVEEQARALHEATFSWLHDHDLPREAVAGVALFRTQAAVAESAALIAQADRLPEAQRPRVLEAAWLSEWDNDAYTVARGYYCTPNFQSGLEHAPFLQKGGTIVRGADGSARPSPIPDDSPYHVAECGGRMRARFVLSVPRTTMPSKGWPLLVYAHGTTGNAFNVLGFDSFAARAAAAGMAAVSTDQPLHGSDDPRGGRPGSAEPMTYKLGPIPIPLPIKSKGGELAFYNLLRPVVVRDNLSQALVDAALLARVTLATDFSTVLGDGAPRFDRAFGYVVSGHSQGSQSAAALGALDPLVRGVLLSACGGDFGSKMLARPDSATPKQIFQAVLGLEPGELDEFHPLVTLVQTILDPVDPRSFGFLYQAPGSHEPRSVLMVNGEGDTMTPDRASAILAASMRAIPLDPLPRPIPELEGLGLTPAAKVSGNGAGGRASLALLQLTPSYVYDGHFVSYYEQVARDTIDGYLRALVNEAPPPAIVRAVLPRP